MQNDAFLMYKNYYKKFNKNKGRYLFNRVLKEFFVRFFQGSHALGSDVQV